MTTILELIALLAPFIGVTYASTRWSAPSSVRASATVAVGRSGERWAIR